MLNEIILNGKSSNELQGLIIQSLPPISKSQIRTQIEQIDGRDGDIITKLGYSSYDKSFDIGLSYNFDIDDIIAFFNSEGTVIFSNEPDKYYNYQIPPRHNCQGGIFIFLSDLYAKRKEMHNAPLSFHFYFRSSKADFIRNSVP